MTSQLSENRIRRSVIQRDASVLAAVAMAGLACIGAVGASASDVQIQACECLKIPGEDVRVTVRYSNTEDRPLALQVAMRLPNDLWFFFSPAGLIHAPTLIIVPAQSSSPDFDVINQTLTSQSLSFGNVPLVGPYRYEFVAGLYDLGSSTPIVPISSTFFDFAPRDPAPFPTEAGSLFLVPHQHNDLAWLAREEVNLPLGAEFIRKAVLEVQRNTEFRFVIDQKPILETFVRDNPGLVDQFRSLIDQGVCELAGGFLVEPDLNLLSGESLVRQAIYGQQYLETRWGRRSRMAWHIDSFGHPHQMPQITQKAGMDYYVFSRGVGDPGVLGGSEFYWESPDGSRVLTHWMPFFYIIGQEIGQTPDTDPELSELFRLLEEQASTRNLLGPVGADVDEQVFNNFVPEAVDHWNLQQIPQVRASVATPSEFFAAVETSGTNLRVLSNMEFQNEHDLAIAGTSVTRRVFPGVYASRIKIKQTNNRLEHRLLDVEKLATLASLEGFDYPSGSLEDLGESIALNQTHDYLSGSGVDEVYEDDDDIVNDLGDRFDAVETGLDTHFQNAADYLTARIATVPVATTARTAIVVFNALAWERKDLVTLEIEDPAVLFPARLVDARDTEIPYQRIKRSGAPEELVFMATVPSMGYATYRLLAGDPSWPVDERIEAATGPITVNVGDFAVDLDGRAFIRRIASSRTQEPLIQGEGLPSRDNLGGVVWWSDELYGDAYNYDPLEQNIGSLAGKSDSVFVVRGPVMTRIVATGALTDLSIAEREVRLVPELDRIGFITTLFWSDVNKNVYVRFPFVDRTGARITEGVPYGFMEREDGHFPALRWAEFGDASLGVAVLNRGLFGHRFSPSTGTRMLDITLLRSLDRAVFGDHPSETMKEHGVHRFEYALLPHHGSWRERGMPRCGWEFNCPLIAFSTDAHGGLLPPTKSYFELNAESDAVLTVLQRENNDIVARLYETSGNAKNHTVSFPFVDARAVSETNLLGDFVRSLGQGSFAAVNTGPQEIVTLRLQDIRTIGPYRTGISTWQFYR